MQKTYGEIIAFFKSLEGFKHQMELEGYIVPNIDDLGWDYVLSVVKEEKTLLKVSDIPNFSFPSR
jgi:hypothetical protein